MLDWQAEHTYREEEIAHEVRDTYSGREHEHIFFVVIVEECMNCLFRGGEGQRCHLVVGTVAARVILVEVWAYFSST